MDDTSAAIIETQAIFASLGVIRSIDDVTAKLGQPSDTFLYDDDHVDGTRKAQYNFTAGLQNVEIIVIEYRGGSFEVLSSPR